MHKKKLVVVRNIKDLKKLNNYDFDGKSVIVGTEDIATFNIASQDKRFEKVIFLEKGDSYFEVANDVIKFVDVINEWLEKNLARKFSLNPDLLAWIKHAEGGYTTQRVQDLFLLIRSYNWIFSEFNIAELLYVESPQHDWEEEIMIACANSKNIPVSSVKSQYVLALYHKAKIFCAMFGRDYFFLANLLWIKLKNTFKFSSDLIETVDVFLSLSSWKEKAILPVVNLVDKLQKHGLKTVTLCWEAFGGAKALRKKGYFAEELENWVSLRCIIDSIVYLFKLEKTLLLKKKEFFSISEFCFEGVKCNNFIWKSLHHSILSDFPQRYRLENAYDNYWKNHTPRVFHHRTAIFSDARLANKSFEKSGKKPLTFLIPWYLYMEAPYEHFAVPLNMIFVASQKSRELYLKKGFSTEMLFDVGCYLFEGFESFQKEFSRTASRNILKLNEKPKLTILIDLNIPLRGYISSREIYGLFLWACNLAEKKKELEIIFKPHPGCPDDVIKMINSQQTSKNVLILPKNLLSYHLFNVVDIIITKYSLLGVEGLKFGCNVFSFIPSGDERFRIFGDASEYFSNFEGMELLIERLLTDESFAKAWFFKKDIDRKKFLSEYFSQIDVPSTELIAQIIKAKLEKLK
ncbi:MAG: hypothetical protein HQM08_21675 [Candidatus Riflebacteria bacterium]|nr:hypothetical protein [Candidatus Riflebacteria bacterium]